jgi:siroheme synthase
MASCTAALIERATLPDQRSIVGTLATLPKLARRHDVRAPALIMIGTVVSLHRELGGMVPAAALAG